MFVDDDLGVLMDLERNLQKMSAKWEMVFYVDPREALAHLADGTVDLVVSDLHIHGMGDAIFLGAAAACSPHTIRFALSEPDDAEEALQLADICHQVLTKPCEPRRLVAKALRALAGQDLLPDRDMQAKVSRIHQLPSRPDIHELLVKELSGDHPSFENIAALVSEDVALTAKVLQIASCSLFSADGVTPGLVTAVSRLGVPRVTAVVRNHGVEAECASRLPEDFSLSGLWLHSYACAIVSQAIASFEKQPSTVVEHAFIAGLLHDIGRLVMAASEPGLYAKMIADVGDPDSARGLDSEARIFRSTHPRFGAYLVGLWGFSEDIVDAVAYHHAPSQCPDTGLGPLTFIHAAEAFCRIPHDGQGAVELALDDDPYYQALGVTDRLAGWRDVTDRMMAEEAVA